MVVFFISSQKFWDSSLTHDSCLNFDLNTNVLGLAQQQHLLAQNALLLGQVLTRHLQTTWKWVRGITQITFFLLVYSNYSCPMGVYSEKCYANR